MTSTAPQNVEKLRALRSLFPDLSSDILTIVLEAHKGDVNAAASELLGGNDSKVARTPVHPLLQANDYDGYDGYSYDGFCRTSLLQSF